MSRGEGRMADQHAVAVEHHDLDGDAAVRQHGRSAVACAACGDRVAERDAVGGGMGEGFRGGVRRR